MRPNAEALATIINGNVGYTPELTEYVIDKVNASEIAKEQVAKTDINVFTGLFFETDDYASTLTMEQVNEYLNTLPASEYNQAQAMFSNMSEEQISQFVAERMKSSADTTATYEGNREKLGIVDLAVPSSIKLYPKDFDSKETLTTLIADYNKMQEDNGHDNYMITYTDIVSLMTSSMSSIINVISYVLIAFVAISLVVSAIMIAIITYISVL